jgi:hypothetical protein
MVSLQFHPDEIAGLLDWAEGICNSYPSRQGILITHSMLYPGGDWSPGGQETYDALKDVPNLALAACGHLCGSGRRTDIYAGHTLHTMVSDFQCWESGGGGYLRYLEIDPAANQLRAFTYSPYLNQSRTDDWNQFTLSVDLSAPPPLAPRAGERLPVREASRAVAAPPAGFALLGAVAGVPSGETANLLWSGLDPLTAYEWCVQVGDGHAAEITGPSWMFTTGATTDVGGAPPRGLALAPPAPNPARGALRLAFELPHAMRVRLDVLDVRGRVVAVLAEGDFGAGSHARVWDASASGDRVAGLYFVRLETPDGRLVRRAMVLR